MRGQRPNSTRRGYEAHWQRISKRTLRERPICEWPDGCDRPATEVHHIDGRGPRGDNSDANLMALCKSHHSRITVAENGGFGRRDPRRRESETHPGLITP